MNAVIPTLTIKDAWRQLCNEGATTIGYCGFRLWVKELYGDVTFITMSRDPNKPDNPCQLEGLRHHAQLMQRGKGSQQKRNAQNKLQVLKALAQLQVKQVSGSQIIRIAEQYGAVSAATLYRRGVEAKAPYSIDQARNFICGGKTA